MAERDVAGLTSVIVVAANSGPLLRECARRVLASNVAVELLVVDNASDDGEVEALQTAHAGDSRLRVWRNAANLGFGPACNRAAGYARGDALLILNPDCLIEPDTIARLRVLAAQSPTTGVIGVRVCDADGHAERAVRRRDPQLRRALMTLTGLSRWQPRWPALAGIEMPSPPSGIDLEPVEAVSGACLFLARAAFRAIGGFDEAYFLHCEDLDLCRRMRDSGRAVLYADGVRVQHQQGSSSRSRPLFVARHKHRGMWRYFRRFDPAADNPLLRVLVYAGIWAHFGVRAPQLAWRQWRSGRHAQS